MDSNLVRCVYVAMAAVMLSRCKCVYRDLPAELFPLHINCLIYVVSSSSVINQMLHMKLVIVPKPRSRCPDAACSLNIISSRMSLSLPLCPQEHGHTTFCSLKRGHTDTSPMYVCGFLRINSHTRSGSELWCKLDSRLPLW